MDNLPKRDDTIYQEIESFEVYELTQCVAYEMAVRNKEVKTIINKLKYIERIKNKLFNNYISLRKIENRNGNSKYKELWLNDMIDSMLNQKLKQNFFIDFGYTQIKEESGVVFLDEPMINKIISNMHENLDDIFAKKSQRYYRNNQKIRDGFIVSQGIFERENEFNKSSIKPNFKRSLLNRGKYTDVGIDLNQPLDEIIAYITHIKNDLKDNKDILKTPLELLGETLEDATPKKDYPKKPTAQKMADMFFIYDYVKVRLKNIQEENKNNTIELEEEIENIKKFHIGADRKKRIAYAKAEHLESTIDTKIIDIFKEDELTKILNLSGANISKLYYAIKPYIDDLKYKELITGVSTK